MGFHLMGEVLAAPVVVNVRPLHVARIIFTMEALELKMLRLRMSSLIPYSYDNKSANNIGPADTLISQEIFRSIVPPYVAGCWVYGSTVGCWLQVIGWWLVNWLAD